MKKILFIILLSNLMFGQLLNNQEQELVPLKKTLNVSALKMDETNLDTRIILDTTRSKIAWLGGLKFAVSNHDGELKMSNGNISLKNNVIWLILYLLAIPAGLFVALFLNQTVTGIRIYKSLFFFPFVISQVVVGLVFSWFYDPSYGLMNIILMAFGADAIPVLADEKYVTYGIIAAGLWPQTAYCMILYLTGLNSVDPEQIEAARLDNARGFKMLWYVILPQLRPATFIALVVTVIGALRSFDLISIMTDGGPWGSSQVLAFYMYEQAFSEYGFRMGYGAAIAVVLFLIMMIYIIGFLWKMYRDERSL